MSTLSARICASIAYALDVENPVDATTVPATTSINVKELISKSA
jgi:hypothetical protein